MEGWIAMRAVNCWQEKLQGDITDWKEEEEETNENHADVGYGNWLIDIKPVGKQVIFDCIDPIHILVLSFTLEFSGRSQNYKDFEIFVVNFSKYSIFQLN